LFQVNGGAYFNGATTVVGKFDATALVDSPQINTNEIYITTPATDNKHGDNLESLNARIYNKLSDQQSYTMPYNGYHQMVLTFTGSDNAEWRLPNQTAVLPGTRVTVINTSSGNMKLYPYDGDGLSLIWEAGTNVSYIDIASAQTSVLVWNGERWLVL